MIFNRDLKDYYCERCKSSLTERKSSVNTSEDTVIETENSAPTAPPEVGTIKGILFMLLGSLIMMINSFLPPVWQMLGIIGLSLLILGFYLIYKDRQNYPSQHISNMRFAAILFVIWIIMYVLTTILNYYFVYDLLNEITDLGNNEVIPS